MALNFKDNLLSKDGEVYYTPGLFSQKESQFFFESLLNCIQWESRSIVMFGKKVFQPRLIAWCSDEGAGYTYSGVEMKRQAWSENLLKIKQRVEQVSGIEYNGALLNHYRNESDSMGWHRDNEPELGHQPLIASVSFGATRVFQMRHREEKELKLNLALEEGSCLIMRGETQTFWSHSLPKRAKKIGPRINITFRKIIGEQE